MTEKQTIDFWFDANCPFTWKTARWARRVAELGRAEIRWHLMSLYKLNAGAEDAAPAMRERLDRTRLAMRVLAAVEDREGPAALERAYFAIGHRLHEDGRTADPALLAEALEEAGLPSDLASAADDPSWDDPVFRSHEEAQAAVGQESGSPVLSFDGTQAFFGPVLVEVPTDEDSVRLLEALRAAARVPQFTELKRSRTGSS